MSTKPKSEVRHRWSFIEEKRLAEESKRFHTVREAADALYVKFGLPYNAVRAKLYELYLKGLAPHLETKHRVPTTGDLGAATLRAIREMARCMRVELISDVLLTLAPGSVQVQIVRKAETLDIEF